MDRLEQTLYDLCKPLVENPATLNVRYMESLNEHTKLIYVYADGNDIARLIGKKGSIATALRALMNIANRDGKERIQIKFESYE